MAAIAAFAAANAGTISLISTAVSAIGAISQANAASQNARSQQQAAEFNAAQANANAHNALQVADANEEAQRRKNAYILGEKRAGLIQAGIGTDGTASDVIAASGTNAELDALNIRYEGSLRAKAYQQQAAQDLFQGQAAGENASAATTAGWLGAGGAVLSGAGSYGKTVQDGELKSAQIDYYKNRGPVLN
jgi:hypothetical protein